MFAEYIEAQYDADEYRIRAAEHIDTLTFNKITDFEQLSCFQQRTLRRVLERLVDFEKENEDILGNSMLNSYSLNGVSMSFGEGKTVRFICGIAIPVELYTMLLKTGLCYPAL